jgi:hypothetical protein
MRLVYTVPTRSGPLERIVRALQLEGANGRCRPSEKACLLRHAL